MDFKREDNPTQAGSPTQTQKRRRPHKIRMNVSSQLALLRQGSSVTPKLNILKMTTFITHLPSPEKHSAWYCVYNGAADMNGWEDKAYSSLSSQRRYTRRGSGVWRTADRRALCRWESLPLVEVVRDRAHNLVDTLTLTHRTRPLPSRCPSAVSVTVRQWSVRLPHVAWLPNLCCPVGTSEELGAALLAAVVTDTSVLCLCLCGLAGPVSVTGNWSERCNFRLSGGCLAACCSPIES